MFADYRRTWAIGALTGTARWLEFVALAIFAYELTQSAELVALLAVLRMAPYVALGLIVGGLADVFDRRRLLEVSVVVVLVAAGAMTAASALNIVGYGVVAGATMLSGAFWTIDMPARRRLMVDSIGPAHMGAGLGFDNATMYATRALGPLIGGIVYELVGLTGVFAVITACYAGCWVTVRKIGRSAGPTARGRLSGMLPSLALVRNPLIQIAMGVTLVFNLWCFPFITMVPVIAQNDFALPYALVGVVTACEGIGGMLGALVVGAVVTERTLFRYYYMGTFLFLVLMAVMSAMLTVAVAVPLLMVIGAASAAFSATQYALIYTLAPPEQRGRATGLLSIFIGSSLVGHYHAGWLFERLGSVSAMQLMAVEGLGALILLGLLWWRNNRGGRN
ncbi:MAG: MFS transporter [Hyphomicrobiaceae bacterium]